MTNNEKLKELMKKYKLKKEDVASMLNISFWTVHNWTVKPTYRMYSNMSDDKLELLMEIVKGKSEDPTSKMFKALMKGEDNVSEK
jgi:DNA-binding transcriptional regulator YiaG